MKEFGWLGRRIRHVLTGNFGVDLEKYAGVGMISDSDANEFVYKGLLGDSPFAIGKTGFSEIGFLACAQNEIYFNSRIHYYWTPSYITNINSLKADNGLQRFYRVQMDSMNELDGIGTYDEMYMCDAILEMLPEIANIKIFCMDILDANRGFMPQWTRALAGKKVLVVSPFYKEIEQQYKKRDLIWPDGRLPEFDLECVPSVWIRDNGGFFGSYKVLSDRIMPKDFDVALLSCGSLGIPLSADIKRSGRKAVHMGSMIHVLFGLKGKRWDDRGIYNEHWIRPGEDTKPAYADKLDGATYW